ENNGDRTLAFAVNAMQPFVRDGFTIREEYWGGNVDEAPSKAITHQLIRGNEYWFCAASSVDSGAISVHVYDENGNLAESEYWRRSHAAGAHVIPRKTAMFYVVVEVEKSVSPQTRWAVIYAFR